jgi:shikimate kinase
VTNPKTRQLLADQRVLWLKVDAKDAARRVGLNTARPLLVGNVHGTLQKLLTERELWYAEVQTETIDTSQKSVRDVVAEAVAILEAR